MMLVTVVQLTMTNLLVTHWRRKIHIMLFPKVLYFYLWCWDGCVLLKHRKVKEYSSPPLIRPTHLQKWENGIISEVASLEGNNLAVFYYLCVSDCSDIWPDKWGWAYKMGGYCIICLENNVLHYYRLFT